MSQRAHAGAGVEAASYFWNLPYLSNAATLWLGMNPPDLFFYVLLPPLLLDAAVRIEFFTFRKVPPRSCACRALKPAHKLAQCTCPV